MSGSATFTMEMSITTTITLAQQIARTDNRERRPAARSGAGSKAERVTWIDGRI
jgi:hypothetical protein